MKNLLTTVTTIMAFLMLTVSLPVFAKTPDGQTPAEEDICTSWGFTGKVNGLCNAYCEAMDCDAVEPQASEQACTRLFDKITGALGDTPFPTCQDVDDDGVPNGIDNCPDDANTDQTDVDGNGVGDVCEYKIVFTTLGLFSGNLGGLDGGDAKCQAEADDAGLTGTFKAWLSDSTTNARDRLFLTGAPYVRVDGEVLWDDFADMTSGLNPASDPAVTPNLAADGTTAGGRVWTGTHGPGTNTGLKGSAGYFCSDWTSTSGSLKGLSGVATAHYAPNWSSDNVQNRCYSLFRLYCFEQ